MSPRGRVSFTFDPRRKGIRKVLGDLEAAVLEEIWKRGDLTVRDVHEKIGGRKNLAYTTVMTVMTRLADKGLLVRRKGEGKAIVYSAAMSREEFLEKAVGSVIRGLMADFASPSMSHLVEMIGEESEGRIEELARLIEERRKKR